MQIYHNHGQKLKNKFITTLLHPWAVAVSQPQHSFARHQLLPSHQLYLVTSGISFWSDTQKSFLEVLTKNLNLRWLVFFLAVFPDLFMSHLITKILFLHSPSESSWTPPNTLLFSVYGPSDINLSWAQLIRSEQNMGWQSVIHLLCAKNCLFSSLKSFVFLTFLPCPSSTLQEDLIA